MCQRYIDISDVTMCINCMHIQLIRVAKFHFLAGMILRTDHQSNMENWKMKIKLKLQNIITCF